MQFSICFQDWENFTEQDGNESLIFSLEEKKKQTCAVKIFSEIESSQKSKSVQITLRCSSSSQLLLYGLMIDLVPREVIADRSNKEKARITGLQ